MVRHIPLSFRFLRPVLALEREGGLHDLTRVVLDIDVDGLLVIAARCVIEAEHLTVERIAVVGQEHRTVVHPQLNLPLGLAALYLARDLLIQRGLLEL